MFYLSSIRYIFVIGKIKIIQNCHQSSWSLLQMQWWLDRKNSSKVAFVLSKFIHPIRNHHHGQKYGVGVLLSVFVWSPHILTKTYIGINRILNGVLGTLIINRMKSCASPRQVFPKNYCSLKKMERDLFEFARLKVWNLYMVLFFKNNK